MFFPDLSGGGAERVMANLAIEFCERGIGVDLVLLKSEGPYIRELPPGVPVVDLKASRMLTELAALARYLRLEKPPVRLSAMYHANVTALLAALLCGSQVPVVVGEQNNATMDLGKNPGIMTTVLRLLMRWLYPRAHNIIAVSKGVADDLGNLLNINANRLSGWHHTRDLRAAGFHRPAHLLAGLVR